MNMFHEVLNLKNEIFKNQDMFTLDYLPEIIQCRDNHLKAILMNIIPLLKQEKTINTILIGNTSTGKTTVLKHALKEINENTALKTCYINCNIQDSARKCYIQIYKVLFGQEARKNLSTEIIQEEVMKKLEDELLVLAIDDLNYLSNNDANKIINDFFRLNEFYDTNIAIIVSINDELFKYSLERNAQNILLGEEIRFNDYTPEEIFKILKYRCDLGLNEGVITDRQIKMISDYTEYQSLRKGLTLISVIGKQVEQDNRNKIEDEDIKRCISSFN